MQKMKDVVFEVEILEEYYWVCHTSAGGVVVNLYSKPFKTLSGCKRNAERWFKLNGYKMKFV